VLLLASVLAGLVGCAPPSEPELVAPSVFYVSRDPHSTNQLHIEEKQAAGVAVTFDASDLKGIAVIKTAMDACPVHLPVFHCKGRTATPPVGGTISTSA
jgi:hypothetical protein